MSTNLENNRRVNRIRQIRRIIKQNRACLVCIKRTHGKIKKYRTLC